MSSLLTLTCHCGERFSARTYTETHCPPVPLPMAVGANESAVRCGWCGVTHVVPDAELEFGCQGCGRWPDGHRGTTGREARVA